MKTSLTEYRKWIERKKIERESSISLVRTIRNEVMEAQTSLDYMNQAHLTVQELARNVQEKIHAQISDIVSRCLEAIFGDRAYEFRIHFESKRGRTEARMVFIRDELETDPMTGSGGGAVDVAAFALQLACLMLENPQRERIMFLDEPFKFLSPNYHPRMRALLESLSEELGFQFVMITQIPTLVTGKVIEL